mgnify:FL=1
MYLVNRAVVIIKPRQPFLDWANSLPDPTPVTLEQLRKDCNAILIPDVDDDLEAERYVRQIYRGLFEMQLAGWHQDPRFWPKQRGYKTFRDWFDVEVHSMVFDASSSPIVREPD